MSRYTLRNFKYYEMDGVTVAGTTQDIFDSEEKVAIPKDESNRHYQAYLYWVSDGNTPFSTDY